MAKSFLDISGMNLIDLAAQSPDLKPIQHLSAHILTRVAVGYPKNIPEIKTYIVEEWNLITEETCEKHALSFKKRALAVYIAM